MHTLFGLVATYVYTHSKKAVDGRTSHIIVFLGVGR